MSVSVSKKGLV